MSTKSKTDMTKKEQKKHSLVIQVGKKKRDEKSEAKKKKEKVVDTTSSVITKEKDSTMDEQSKPVNKKKRMTSACRQRKLQHEYASMSLIRPRPLRMYVADTSKKVVKKHLVTPKQQYRFTAKSLEVIDYLIEYFGNELFVRGNELATAANRKYVLTQDIENASKKMLEGINFVGCFKGRSHQIA